MIVHLASGAGDMFCGSCLHENTLASALTAAGEDVLLVPLYTPLRTDESGPSIDRVAFGGINVYLQQRFALFRHTPRLLDRLLDRPGLLRFAARHGRGTRAEKLGPLTVSMLRGEQGRQRKELDKLADWLAAEVQPELIHLSNALLVGMARQLKSRLRAKVVCTLSGEDAFLEQLPEPHYSKARDALRQRAAELDGLAALNRYYAAFMAEYLDLPLERIDVISAGLNLDGHARPEGPSSAFPKNETITVGYLGRVCHQKGLHMLAEALEILCADAALPPIRVQAAGYLDPVEQPYLDDVLRLVSGAGLNNRFEYLGELDRPGKIAMLQSCDLVAAPALHPESKGLTVLEAWANGIPAVLPDAGAFPEMLETTGGGLLFEPGNAASLAARIRELITQPERARQSGEAAQRYVHQHHHAPGMAQATAAWYRRIISVGQIA